MHINIYLRKNKTCTVYIYTGCPIFHWSCKTRNVSTLFTSQTDFHSFFFRCFIRNKNFHFVFSPTCTLNMVEFWVNKPTTSQRHCKGRRQRFRAKTIHPWALHFLLSLIFLSHLTCLFKLKFSKETSCPKQLYQALLSSSLSHSFSVSSLNNFHSFNSV